MEIKKINKGVKGASEKLKKYVAEHWEYQLRELKVQVYTKLEVKNDRRRIGCIKFDLEYVERDNLIAVTSLTWRDDAEFFESAPFFLKYVEFLSEELKGEVDVIMELGALFMASLKDEKLHNFKELDFSYWENVIEPSNSEKEIRHETRLAFKDLFGAYKIFTLGRVFVTENYARKYALRRRAMEALTEYEIFYNKVNVVKIKLFDDVPLFFSLFYVEDMPEYIFVGDDKLPIHNLKNELERVRIKASQEIEKVEAFLMNNDNAKFHKKVKEDKVEITIFEMGSVFKEICFFEWIEGHIKLARIDSGEVEIYEFDEIEEKLTEKFKEVAVGKQLDVLVDPKETLEWLETMIREALMGVGVVVSFSMLEAIRGALNTIELNTYIDIKKIEIDIVKPFLASKAMGIILPNASLLIEIDNEDVPYMIFENRKELLVYLKAENEKNYKQLQAYYDSFERA